MGACEPALFSVVPIGPDRRAPLHLGIARLSFTMITVPPGAYKSAQFRNDYGHFKEIPFDEAYYVPDC